MNFLYKLISKLPNYIRSFGIFHGLRLLFLIEGTVPRRSTITKKYTVPSFPGSIYLRKTISDHSIFWQCIVQRQYDMLQFPQSNRLVFAYQEYVEKGHRPLIIDCGANIGLSTLFLAMLFPKAIIYAVEPDENNFMMLKLNTASLGDRVVALRGGIWYESANLRIVNPESGSASFRVATTTTDDNSSEIIRTYTIDEICALAEASSPLIVKVDIEGSQSNLFRNNTNWVSNTHLIMLELDDWLMPWEGTSRSFFSCVSQYPFDYLISGETIFCFRDYEG